MRPKITLMLEAQQAPGYPPKLSLSRTVDWRNRGLPSTIQLMDPSLISKVMQEMGRKGGKKGGKKGAKMRAEALTPERRTQIARKAAKTRWAKVKKKR
jgi:hypothetical protein